MDNLIFYIISSIVTFFISFFLTMKIRSYALRKDLIDHPNERSSHNVPTPRGGGLSVVIAFFLGLAATSYFALIPTRFLYAIICGGIPIAAIGFWDDHGHIASKWRLLVQFLAAIACVYFIGGIPGFYILDYYINPGILSYPIGILTIVWLINLTNFMDGIDGIASSEAICFGLAASVILFLNIGNDLFLLCFIFISACLGFLVWNWPTARIFMGDVCSGFLGYIFAVFILYKSSGSSDSKTFIPLLLILGIFIVDATQTLFVRLFRGEKFHEPHRTHAYQHASRKYNHLKVTCAVLAINIIFMLPISIVAYIFPKYAVFLLIFSYIILSALAFKFKSGFPEE